MIHSTIVHPKDTDAGTHPRTHLLTDRAGVSSGEIIQPFKVGKDLIFSPGNGSISGHSHSVTSPSIYGDGEGTATPQFYQSGY